MISELSSRLRRWARHTVHSRLYRSLDVVRSFAPTAVCQAKPMATQKQWRKRPINYNQSSSLCWSIHYEITVINLLNALSVRYKCSSDGFTLKNCSNAIVNSTATSSNTWTNATRKIMMNFITSSVILHFYRVHSVLVACECVCVSVLGDRK